MQKKPLINAVDEVLSKAKVGLDENLDKVQENPDSGPERPDEKASVKKAKKSTSGSNEDSSMLNYEIDQTKQKKSAPVKSKKDNLPNLPTEDVNFGSEIEKALNQNKNRIENINQTKLEEDSFIESNKKKSKASESPEEIVQEGVQMAKASIKSIVKHANTLMMGLNPTNEMCLSEPWIQSKITIIEDYLKAVHDYVMYYKEEGDE